MADYKVIETFYSTHHKYTVVERVAGMFSSTEFHINKDGKYHAGSYSSLRDAVRAAEKMSGDKR